jgi:hypothetical protein
MRRCSNCFQEKPDTEFYRKLNGLQSRCKGCNAAVVRGYSRRRRSRLIAERWARIYGRTA